MNDETLRDLARQRGITPGYHDAMGTWREPPVDVLRALLDTLGDPVEPGRGGTLVVRAGDPRPTPEAARGGTVRTEDGRELAVPDELPGGLPEGYHVLEAGGHTTHLIVVPDTAYLPPVLRDGGRMWGVGAQLYAVHSARSWGIGDLGDLSALTACIGGPDFILVNPLHAPTPAPHIQPSPYFASSRVFRNPLHLAVDLVPEVGHLDAAQRAEFAALQAQGRALCAGSLIDRDAIWPLKRRALDLLLACASRIPERRAALQAFRQAMPEVDRFGRFCALAERHGTPDWRAWGDGPDPDPHDVDLHVLAQFLLEEQLAALPPMPLGLMTDLAVGADRAGYDAWAHPQVVGTTVRVGCPPDQLGPEGQDWGVPPLLPTALASTGYALFAQIVRTAMRHAGGLRIDHVMGLSRLFMMPDGATPLEGTYVRMPLDDLLGIVCLESRRARCMVVGEDLGTVEEGFRERVGARGLLSYRLAWFEDRPAAEYPRTAMAAVTTHDLPTVAGFFGGADIQHLRDIGANAPEVLDVIAERQPHERHRIRERLEAEGLPGAWSEDDGDIATALSGFLALTPCMLACASLDDVAGAVVRANVPGTVDQHPNWRVPLPITLEEIAAAERTRRVLGPLRDRDPAR